MEIENKKKVEQLLEKWQPVLESEGEAPIKDRVRKSALAVCFENMVNEGTEVPMTERLGHLMETDIANVSNSLQGSGGDTLARFDPIMVSLVRRAAPMMIGFDIMGVQPMTGPTGLIFALRSGYANTTSGYVSEALFYEANTAFSGNSSITPTSLDGRTPYANSSTILTTGTGMSTLGGEQDTWLNMGMSLEKHSIEAKTRKIATDYTYELVTDLKKVNNIDAEEELTNILTTELTAATNRDLIHTVYNVAVPGGTSNTGIVDLSVGGEINGRWFGEQWKGLVHQIRIDSIKIQKDTKRGAGNILLVDAETAAALADIKALDYSKMLGDRSSLSDFPDETNSTFVGMLGTMKVFVDPYVNLGFNFYVVGYKGNSFGDYGLIYAPYTPATQFRVTVPTSMEPRMGFKVRYGVTENPYSYSKGATKFTDTYNASNAHKNVYYRVSNISNIMG